MLLVVNKVLKSLSFEDLKHKIEAAYELPVAGVFPLTEEVIQLASNGVFCLQYPHHPVSQEFLKVAQEIIN